MTTKQRADAMRRYFDIIHKYTPDEALIGVTTIIATYTATRWYQHRFLDQLIEDAIAIDAKANVYARITPLLRKPDYGRGKERHSAGSSVLFVDYDTYTSQLAGMAALQAMPIPPTMIVNSGNGLHAYWLLDRLYTDIDEIKARNKALALLLGGKEAGGDSCFDLARVLRIPGTYNAKRDTPLSCDIVFEDTSRVYTLDMFTPAVIEDDGIEIWDSKPLPADFIETLRERDPKLAKRILSEESAKKVDAALNGDGRVDRSRNDAFIATRLLALGYDPAEILAVLMAGDWFSGSKYRERLRYDYVVMTVNAAVKAFQNSADRYFVKATFVPDRLAGEMQARNTFIYAAERLWRYDAGAFRGDGEDWLKLATVKQLGSRWSSRASDETIRYIIDQSRIPLDKLNNHEGLINCANGMLEVDSGNLLAHDPRFYSTAQIPALYDPQVDTTAIDKFFAEVLPADAIALFFEFVGSIFLTGRYWPKAFVALVGRADSGKSKVLEVLIRFLGGATNVSALSLQTLADNKFAAAALYGKLANIFSDLDESEAQNVGQLKTLTGGDPISGEQKYRGFFLFKNTARLMFSANGYPSVRAPDEAFFRRALIIPTTNVFSGSKADAFIVDKMTTPANLSAILLRAFQGLQRLRKQDYTFTPSATIEAATTEYRFMVDTVSGFLHACVFDPQFVIPKQQLYQHYDQACKRANRKPVSEDKFFKRVSDNLERFGMTETYKQLDGTRVWCYCGRKPVQIPDVLTATTPYITLPAN